MFIASMNYSTEVAMAIALAIVCFLFHISFFRSKGQPWSWPFIGMLHLCFPISTNIFDSFTKILEHNKGTFVYRGPWFSGRNMIITCDPTNYQHILSSKFSNYPKGSDTYMLFDPYGKFLFTHDFDVWRSHRKFVNAFFSDQTVQCWNLMVHMEIFKNGMILVLDHASQYGQVLDLKEILKRLFLDITIMSATGYNHNSLCIELPKDPLLTAIVDINRGILLRHILPEKIWKLQRLLGIGQEKRVVDGSRIIDKLISKYMQMKKEERKSKEDKVEASAINFLSISDEVKREFLKGLVFASVDTTSAVLNWFFWLIQENPTIETKIRQEIETKLLPRNNKCFESIMFLDPKELNKLVYLHATLLEALRLYPSIPLQSRTCVETDILPSGHRIKSGMKVTLVPYATARMKSIWGEDCREYNPERWISTDKNGESRIFPVSSTKFCSFSSGSRICPGKDLGILRLKSVAATIIYNYDIQLLKNYPITPSKEILLEMKYPFHVKIRKR